jgi:hypothetical protein
MTIQYIFHACRAGSECIWKWNQDSSQNSRQRQGVLRNSHNGCNFMHAFLHCSMSQYKVSTQSPKQTQYIKFCEWRITTGLRRHFPAVLKNGAKNTANIFVVFKMAARAVKTFWVADGQLEVSLAGESSHASVADQAGRSHCLFL